MRNTHDAEWNVDDWRNRNAQRSEASGPSSFQKSSYRPTTGGPRRPYGGDRYGGDRYGGDRFGGGGAWNLSERKPVVYDGTWHTRDGRRAGEEKENDIFKSTKEKTTGINFDSYDSIEVSVSGPGADDIEPLSSFRDGPNIPAKLSENIIRVRYDKPTPVQKYAIPILLANRDLMACAQTGSGKTAAFLFPIIIKMLRDGPPAKVVNDSRDISRPVALVLSPTRELTMQIYEESRKFAFQTGIRTVVVYGGADIRDQLHELRQGCDICVATPGRLNDILERGRASLSQIKYLVLDEADRMLDMGFAPQIEAIVLDRDLPSDGRQTTMFSATFPREIQQLARKFLRDYVYLTVGRVGSTNEFITQNLIYAEEVEKPRRLLALLKDSRGRVLVFVETKKKADVIEGFLIKEGLKATSIHGDRTQMERNRALDLFKGGACPILVATDVAARGLDIHSITWVINLDLPHNIEDYVHRIGRTGRAGNAGTATSFVNESNRPILRELLRLLEEANQEIPKWFLDLSRACSSATTRFGPTRYGGGGTKRGGLGSSTHMGGTDIRPFEEGAERRTYNGMSPRGMGSFRNSNRSMPFTGRNQTATRLDDCW